MSNIFQSLPIYAAAISNETGVKIRVSGKTAYVANPTKHRGWEITIPMFDSNDKKLVDLAYGYCLHEVSHIKFTDFEFGGEWMKSVSPATKHLGNVFEDMFIERELRKQLKGAFKRFSKVRTHLQSNLNQDYQNHPTQVLLKNMIYFYGFSINGYSDIYYSDFEAIKAELETRLPSTLVNGLVCVLNAARTTRSTKDCAKLAEEVIQFLEDQKQSDDDSQQGSSDDDSDDDSQQGSSDDDSDDGSQQGSSVSKVIQDFLNDDDDSTDTFESTLQQLLNDGSDPDALDSFEYDDGAVMATNPDIKRGTLPSNDFGVSELIRSEARKESLFLAQKLQGLIAAKMELQIDRKRSGRRLTNNAGISLMQGDFRIFKSTVEFEMPNTSICILLDDSASMDGIQNSIAVRASFAIVDALQRFPFVKTNVTTFGASDGSVTLVKKFEEDAFICSRRLAKVQAKGDCTPLGTGMWGALKQLQPRTENRKIIIVITDGQPNMLAECQDMIKNIRNSSGIEVFGIGIGSGAAIINNLFGNQFAVSVNKLSDLSNEIFKLTEGILLSE